MIAMTTSNSIKVKASEPSRLEDRVAASLAVAVNSQRERNGSGDHFEGNPGAYGSVSVSTNGMLHVPTRVSSRKVFGFTVQNFAVASPVASTPVWPVPETLTGPSHSS